MERARSPRRAIDWRSAPYNRSSVRGGLDAVVLTLFAAPVYGGLVAEAVKRASGHKRGPMLEAIAVGSVVIGYLVAALPYVFMLFMANSSVAGGPSAAAATHAMFGGLALTILWRLLGLGLAVSACYGRMKYF